MRMYEAIRVVAGPALSVLNARVRRDLRQLVASPGARPFDLLDVGARKSPYTIGVPARVTLLDMWREGDIMEQLKLGYTPDQLAHRPNRRSNVVDVVIQDMTQCTLPSASFAGVVCVEVIEHVAEDDAFVKQIARVLKPGGWAYFTTPNGDYIPNTNPDHVRHYRREELYALMAHHFDQVDVTYGIKTGRFRRRGVLGIDVRHPIRAVATMVSNLINHLESHDLEKQPQRTAHLFALARKAL